MTNLETIRESDRIEGELQRSTNRLVSLVRRAERDGFGRNERASREAIDRYLAAGRVSVRELCEHDGWNEARHGRLVERFWKMERRALDL